MRPGELQPRRFRHRTVGSSFAVFFFGGCGSKVVRMNEWRIGRRQVGCAACQREFEEGERHFSLLAVRGEELLREDFCAGCWSARALQSVPDSVRELLWWRTRHYVGKRRGLALNIEAIEALFLGLEGRAEVALRELRYLLCLILMRKRRLKTARILRDAQGESFIVRRPRREEELRVFVYDFTPERVAELRDKLRRIFEGAEPESAFAAAQGETLSASGALDAEPAG